MFRAALGRNTLEIMCLDYNMLRVCKRERRLLPFACINGGSCLAPKHETRPSLGRFVDSLQEQGRYTFLREELTGVLDRSPDATKVALHRLSTKGRVVAPMRGFYVVVPLEYRSVGCPPASWFIDDLMNFLGRPYYVGLLTAASLHGAAHHAVQEFQVVTSRQLRKIEFGRMRIRFFTKRSMERAPVVSMKTDTGSMRVSTPEVTALDLIRYSTSAGELGNVATVLSELGERLDPAKLLDVADGEGEVPPMQRLGFLLERVGSEEALVPIENWLGQRAPRPVPLNPRRASKGSPLDERWQVLVNEDVEAEA